MLTTGQTLRGLSLPSESMVKETDHALYDPIQADWVVKPQHKQMFIWKQIGSYAELLTNQRSFGTFSTKLYTIH